MFASSDVLMVKRNASDVTRGRLLPGGVQQEVLVKSEHVLCSPEACSSSALQTSYITHYQQSRCIVGNEDTQL